MPDNALAGFVPAARRLPRTMAGGRRIKYRIARLGSDEVAAVAHVGDRDGEPDRFLCLTEQIALRQKGHARPFLAWQRMIDALFLRPNWIGNAMSGGRVIAPGAIGDVDVGCTGRMDRIAKEHDIRYWLALNFESGCDVELQINGFWVTFKVTSIARANLGLMAGLLGLVSRRRRALLPAATSPRR
jgi:hypothetical protein